ncbi:MAG: hypothetical protein K2M57_09490 [Paramuribaculum sp.]|nr:hypothetical protein [Paramuribaculum sp.]
MSEQNNRTNALEERITAAVEDFAANDQAFTDMAMLRIDPATLEVEIVEEPESEAIENDDKHDYVALMDLVDADPENPGLWIADREVIADLAAEY